MASKPFLVPNSITVLPAASNAIVETIKAASGQSVDLTQWLDYTGSILSKVDNAGNFSGVAGYYSGDVTIGGGDLLSTTSTFNLVNSTATTINFGAAATTLNIANGSMTSGVVNIGTNNTSGTITLGTSTTNTVIQGNLTVNGTTTTVNSTTVSTQDLNFNVASNATTAAGANNAGLLVGSGLNISWYYDNGNTAWTSSENVNLANGKTFKINGTDVLSATILGSNVVNSNLSKVGTLTTGVWNATSINVAYTDAKVVSVAVGGVGLSVNANTGAITVTSNATNVNTGSTIVARDAAGNFAANTITGTLSGTATQVSNSLTFASGLAYTASTFNGSAAVTVGLSTVSLGTNGANFVKTTIDSYGRVTATGAVSSGDIITALGYTPTNSSSSLTGTGSANKVTLWNGTSTVTYDTELAYDSTNDVLQVAHANVKGSTTETTIGTTTADLDSFTTSTYRSAKYLIQTRNSGSTIFQVSEALLIHDGTTAYVTEYGQIYTSGTAPLITLSATISAGTVKLQATGAAAGNVVRFTRISMNS